MARRRRKGLNEGSQVRSAWKTRKTGTVPSGRLIRSLHLSCLSGENYPSIKVMKAKLVLVFAAVIKIILDMLYVRRPSERTAGLRSKITPGLGGTINRPTGTAHPVAGVPGTSYLATFIESLRDNSERTGPTVRRAYGVASPPLRKPTDVLFQVVNEEL
jgi:hypothetical protein